jgi:hypothetical protein
MKLSVIVLICVSLTLIGGVFFLAFWEIPAPVSSIERDISDDKRQH